MHCCVLIYTKLIFIIGETIDGDDDDDDDDDDVDDDDEQWRGEKRKERYVFSFFPLFFFPAKGRGGEMRISKVFQ